MLGESKRWLFLFATVAVHRVQNVMGQDNNIPAALDILTDSVCFDYVHLLTAVRLALQAILFKDFFTCNAHFNSHFNTHVNFRISIQ